ncbi:maltose O-acetyltransferase [Clostridium sp. W14A]|nr:maltose O-acetyltransferase [Clostridium sp. W14A]
MTDLTEKEKMLSGLPYIGDQALAREHRRAADLLYDFNHTRPSEAEKRIGLLRELFGSVGESFWVEPPFRCDYGGNISVGDHFYANYNCVFLDCAKITIGSHAFFAPGVSLYTAGHPVHREPRNRLVEYALPITIGDSVWLGGGVIVCPGVTVGDGAVVGAGSVVTHDIPANVVAAGNPCRVLRAITEEDRRYYCKRRPLPDGDPRFAEFSAEPV